MFELIEKFSPEARRVLFSIVGDAMQKGQSEITSENLAAALLRSDDVAEFVRQSAASVGSLLQKLEASPQGEEHVRRVAASVRSQVRRGKRRSG